MKDKKIKIYVTCFNNKILVPDNELIELVQGGSANAPVRFSGMLHDDEGDNISELNPRFNDMATIYWAWKNCDNAYYGFMQYRRFLSFDTEMLKAKKYEYPMEKNDDAAFESMKLTDPAYMRNYIEQYDVITCNYLQYPPEYSLYQQYYEVTYAHEKDMDLLIEIIQKKYPKYMPAVRESLFRNGKGYFANLFIMRKELFQKYCAWAFDILFEFDRRMDYTDYSSAERRAPGYMSERLLGIFYTHLKMTANCKFGMLQKCFFKTTREQPLDPPDFDAKKVVPVVFSVNKEFIPYCGVTISSILKNRSPDFFYDFVILHIGLTPYVIKRFTEGCKERNCSVRFVDVSSFFSEKILRQIESSSIKSYFRFAICDIMAKYEKAIYLDSDIIVRRDVASLAETDLSGYVLAAVQDAETAGLYNGYRATRKKFAEKRLKFNNPYDYFQDGVLVYNIKEFKKLVSFEQLLALARQEWDLAEQDILNYIAQGHVKYLDMAWNVLNDWAGIRRKDIIGIAPESLREQYEQARNDPYIIHYAGLQKPWGDPKTDMAEYYFQAEHMSALFEDIQTRRSLLQYTQYFTDSQLRKMQGGSLKTKPWGTALKDYAFPASNLTPAFPKDNIAIGMLSSSSFLPFTAVTIQSVVEHGNPEKNYDFLIFTDGIKKEQKEKMLSAVEAFGNTSVRFINVAAQLALLNGSILPQYISLLYIRVIWAHILIHYDQLICIDSDMLVLADVSGFENADFNGNYIMAAHEWTYDKEYGHDLKLENYMEIPINAGFSVHNLKKIREDFSADMLIRLCGARNWRYMDQDVLNVLYQKKICYLNYDWNYRMDLDVIGALHITECLHNQQYLWAEPKIIHFAGRAKPWELSGVRFEEKFWNVAERSAFYREILEAKMSNISMRTTQYVTAGGKKDPNRHLIRPNHPIRKYLNVLLPWGSRRREFVKKIVRLFK